MSKCNKVKNPCKICLGPVSQKNGLQCQGACQSWVHYSCLNYTPGKIKDIKAGIIKVTCPCPDCKTSVPKEYRTDQPYSCNNTQCPANRPPKCDNMMCPTNESGKGGVVRPVPCPLSKCGDDCKQYSSPQIPPPAQNVAQCAPAPHKARYSTVSPMSSSEACLTESNPNKCPSGCSSNNEVAGDMGVYQMGMASSGSMPSFHVVEQMCNTVGQLTNQINELMCKMKQAVKDKNGSGGSGGSSGCPPKPTCQQRGPKSDCPKPCYCPGNPARRK